MPCSTENGTGAHGALSSPGWGVWGRQGPESQQDSPWEEQGREWPPSRLLCPTSATRAQSCPSVPPPFTPAASRQEGHRARSQVAESPRDPGLCLQWGQSRPTRLNRLRRGAVGKHPGRANALNERAARSPPSSQMCRMWSDTPGYTVSLFLLNPDLPKQAGAGNSGPWWERRNLVRSGHPGEAGPPGGAEPAVRPPLPKGPRGGTGMALLPPSRGSLSAGAAEPRVPGALL